MPIPVHQYIARYLRVFGLVVLFVCLRHVCPAQDIITPMLQQIAKLEVSLQEIKKGYAIVQQGLNVIGDFKQGAFDLHNGYFSSLLSVNPSIKAYSRVADIIHMQVTILSSCSSTVSQLTASGVFTGKELSYLSAVLSNLSDLTGKDMDELIAILTDGTWQMSDDQRLSRIDALYKQVQQKYDFLKTYGNQVRALGLGRSRSQSDLQTLSKLFQP